MAIAVLTTLPPNHQRVQNNGVETNALGFPVVNQNTNGDDEEEQLTLSDFPESLQNNKAFLRKAIDKKPMLWYKLPAEFWNDMSFLYALSDFLSVKLF